MKTPILKYALLLVMAQVINAQPGDFPELSGPYLGQKPPGMTPELFAPGIISTESHEFSCCFSPDGNEFYFSRRHPDLNQVVVMFSRIADGNWTEPEVAPFVEGQFSFEPFVTPDNKRLYFQSMKVAEGKPDMVTFYVARTDSGWSKIVEPGAPFNPGKTMHISATTEGTIYTTDISGGMGSEALAMIRREQGDYKKLEKLGLPFNAVEKQQHPWIAPDESYLVFTVRKPGQPPASVLFCSFRDKNGNWTEPRELKLDVSAGQPFVTFDGKYLFFTSGEMGHSDISWVSADIIKELKPKE